MAASPNIHAVVGTDDGRVKDEALQLYRRLTGGEDDGFTHETIDGNADNSEHAFQICRAAVEALQTLPFFGGGKVVWLKGVNFLADDVTGRSERTLSGIENLQSCLHAGLGPGVTFLLSATGIDKRRAFWKFLEKSASVAAFDKIDTSRDGWEDEVALLIRRLADPLGLDFEPEALELFIMLAGEATRQIGNELEKLHLFLGPDRRTVTTDDVRRMVPLTRAGIVFEIGNALQHGQTARAIGLIDQQLERGESAIGLMRASIIPTIRNLFMARLLIDRKIPVQNYKSFTAAIERLPEIDRLWLPQKKTGGINAYPVFLAVRGAERFSSDGLRLALESALKADAALVTSSLDPRLVLHRLVAELTSARRR